MSTIPLLQTNKQKQKKKQILVCSSREFDISSDFCRKREVTNTEGTNYYQLLHR